MLELMGICIELDDASLATYPQGSQWKVWKEKKLRPHYGRSSNVKVWIPANMRCIRVG